MGRITKPKSQPKSRATELKAQLTGNQKKKATLSDGLSPQAKAAATRARKKAMLNGDYSSYTYTPTPPKDEPEVRHFPSWRYWWCCACTCLCWFPKNESVDLSMYPYCGSGKRMDISYCGHKRCAGCKVESVEGEGWLHPEISPETALKYTTEIEEETTLVPTRARAHSDKDSGSNSNSFISEDTA